MNGDQKVFIGMILLGAVGIFIGCTVDALRFLGCSNWLWDPVNVFLLTSAVFVIAILILGVIGLNSQFGERK